MTSTYERALEDLITELRKIAPDFANDRTAITPVQRHNVAVNFAKNVKTLAARLDDFLGTVILDHDDNTGALGRMGRKDCQTIILDHVTDEISPVFADFAEQLRQSEAA